MRRVLPVGTASAGVKEIVIVTEPVFLATLLSEMDGALVPRDPLTIATHVPLLLVSRITFELVVIDDCKLLDAMAVEAGFVTVPGRCSMTLSPPARVPVENVTVSLVPEPAPDIAAVAAGVPRVGSTTTTVPVDI
jgi:hypothetical protein